MLQQILDALTPLITNQLSIYILAALGLSGGVWLFIVKTGIKDFLIPQLKKDAAYLDEKHVEAGNLEKLSEAQKAGDSNAIHKAADDLING